MITGASAGISYEIAKLFAKDGVNLVLVARRKELLESIKTGLEQQYSIHVETIAIDCPRLAELLNCTRCASLKI